MIEYRKARPEEREAYISFADMVFTGDSFEQILPKVYGPDVDSAWMQTLAVDSEKGIRAMVAVMPGRLHAGDQTLKTGFVGTVCVHPEARGEGHMKKLMAIALEDMQNDDVDIAILHGQRQRYEYFGYIQGGSVYECRVNGSNLKHALSHVKTDGVRFVPVQSGSELERSLNAIHSRRPMYFERNEFKKDCMSFLFRLYAAVLDDKAIGWIVCANGACSEVSEIAADSVENFDVILKAWMERNDLGAVEFVIPESDNAILRHVCTYAGRVSQTCSGNIRVLRHARVLDALMKVKARYAYMADGEMSFDIDGERFSVAVNGGEVRIGECGDQPICLSQPEADMLFFYPHNYEGRIRTPEGWFPLPLHAATADSF